mmetsp:Transcript_17587/g.49731  ORF Transcript_17587/g.49731 Transcript_17587/m.49731 type:complete len:251 (-) Transcript_17587:105-857(-)
MYFAISNIVMIIMNVIGIAIIETHGIVIACSININMINCRAVGTTWMNTIDGIVIVTLIISAQSCGHVGISCIHGTLIGMVKYDSGVIVIKRTLGIITGRLLNTCTVITSSSSVVVHGSVGYGISIAWTCALIDISVSGITCISAIHVGVDGWTGIIRAHGVAWMSNITWSVVIAVTVGIIAGMVFESRSGITCGSGGAGIGAVWMCERIVGSVIMACTRTISCGGSMIACNGILAIVIGGTVMWRKGCR